MIKEHPYKNAKCDENIVFDIFENNDNKLFSKKIIGFCLDLKNRDFKGIRAVLESGKVYKAKRKHYTSFLKHVFKEIKNVEYSGFVIDIELPKTRWNHKVRIEYRLVDGTWNLLNNININTSWYLYFKSLVIKDFTFINNNENNYKKWIRNYGTLLKEDITNIKKDIKSFNKELGFSIICPVYNPSIKFLKQCIDSVINQLYTNWELFLVDANSTNKDIKDILEYYQKKDSRIKVVFRKENSDIYQASNDGIKICKKEFITFLDNEDKLSEHALYSVAKAIDNNSILDIIYSDEDKIDKNNIRFNPYFKPDFNYELYLAQNFVSHLTVYRRSLVNKVGGFHVGYKASQDWDLCLRCIENTSFDKIFHICDILYHRRSRKSSTVKNINEKSYFTNTYTKAVKSHLKRKNINAKVKIIKKTGYVDIIYDLPEHLPEITIIIPIKNKLHFIKNLVNDLLNKTSYPSFKILILDNDSDEKETIKYLREIEKNEIIEILHVTGEFNYSKINNIGVKHAKSPYICLLNNDILIINKNWLKEMMRYALLKDVGAVGAKLLYESKKIQHAGVILGLGGVAGHVFNGLGSGTLHNFCRAQLAQSYLACTGACLLMKKKLFIEVDGFDEINLPIAFNDIDLCLKIHELGYRNIYTPKATLYHLESASRKGLDETLEGKNRFKKEISFFSDKWGKYIKHDPNFNPNFSSNSSKILIKTI